MASIIHRDGLFLCQAWAVIVRYSEPAMSILPILGTASGTVLLQSKGCPSGNSVHSPSCHGQGVPGSATSGGSNLRLKCSSYVSVLAATGSSILTQGNQWRGSIRDFEAQLLTALNLSKGL